MARLRYGDGRREHRRLRPGAQRHIARYREPGEQRESEQQFDRVVSAEIDVM